MSIEANSIRYKNIRIEMARNNLTVSEIAKAIGMVYNTLKRKLTNGYAFTLNEAITLRDTCFSGCSLEYLFSELFTEHNYLLPTTLEKLTVMELDTGKEIAVITNNTITTAESNIVVKLKPK